MPNPFNTAEGGTNGTTVLTSNSGGASGTAFDSVTAPPGDATLIFDNTHVAHGTLAYKFQIGATSTQLFLQWLASFSASNVAYAKVSFNSYWTANPAASAYQLHVASAAAAQVCGVRINTSGQLIIVNQAGTTIGTMTSAIPLNAWFRVEVDVALDALQTSVQVTVARFDNIDSGQATDTVTATGATAVPFSRIRFGWGGAATTNAGPWWMDDLAVWVPSASTPAWPGQTWWRAFKHRQQQLQPSVAAAAPVTTTPVVEQHRTALRIPWARARARATQVPPPQVVTPPPAWIPDAGSPSPRSPWARRRRPVETSVTVAVTAPPVPTQPPAPRRRFMPRARPRQAVPPLTITTTAIVEQHRTSLRAPWRPRRPRQAQPVPTATVVTVTTTPVVPQARTSLRVPWPMRRRGRQAQVVPPPAVVVTTTPVVEQHRTSLRVPWLSRSKPRQAEPVQTPPVVVTVAVWVPQPGRPRRTAWPPFRKARVSAPPATITTTVVVEQPRRQRPRPTILTFRRRAQPVPAQVITPPPPWVVQPPVRRRRWFWALLRAKPRQSQPVQPQAVSTAREITIIADLTATRWGFDVTSSRYGSDIASGHYDADQTSSRYGADQTGSRYGSDVSEQ